MKTQAFVAALTMCVPQSVAAQPRDASHAQFIESARRATARFRDIEVAIAESYVKVGPDFPAMGEHWVNGELLMKAQLDPTRPAILTYVMIDGKRSLTGAVYALALRSGERPPASLGGQWHDHVGTVDEESLLFGHDRVSGDDDLRLVVMHAWLWVENPAGMFVTDNWALPFARHGVDPPADTDRDAARALALISERDDFQLQLLASAGELTEQEVASVSAVIERHRGSLTRWWRSRTGRGTRAVTRAELDALRERWRALESEALAAISPPSAARLRRVLHPAPHHSQIPPDPVRGPARRSPRAGGARGH